MLKRMTRAESQALTRRRLLESARDLFGREGYANTSIDRIADAAGYSKGAVYSNFEGKEAIFLEVLDAHGQASLDELILAIDSAGAPDRIVDLLVSWADNRSRSDGWSLTILEHARAVGPDAPSLLKQTDILKGHWARLGTCVLTHFPQLQSDALTLGALLHEIAYAPAMTFVRDPTAGNLMRLTLRTLLRP